MHTIRFLRNINCLAARPVGTFVKWASSFLGARFLLLPHATASGQSDKVRVNGKHLVGKARTLYSLLARKEHTANSKEGVPLARPQNKNSSTSVHRSTLQSNYTS